MSADAMGPRPTSFDAHKATFEINGTRYVLTDKRAHTEEQWRRIGQVVKRTLQEEPGQCDSAHRYKVSETGMLQEAGKVRRGRDWLVNPPTSVKIDVSNVRVQEERAQPVEISEPHNVTRGGKPVTRGTYTPPPRSPSPADSRPSRAAAAGNSSKGVSPHFIATYFDLKIADLEKAREKRPGDTSWFTKKQELLQKKKDALAHPENFQKPADFDKF